MEDLKTFLEENVGYHRGDLLIQNSDISEFIKLTNWKDESILNGKYVGIGITAFNFEELSKVLEEKSFIFISSTIINNWSDEQLEYTK